MPLETATFVSDLVTSNPPTSDIETQGANHLQLIKSVLQNTFGVAARRFVGLGSTQTFSGNVTLTVFQSSFINLINTSGGTVNITLPTLGALDAGWECSFIKTTTDANPFFLIPPSGTIQSGEYTGLAKTRRCIPGRRTKVIWTGSAFIAERVNWQPVGSIIDNANATLPVGYEWPNGQTLAGVSGSIYPEYFAVFGGLITPDARGRAIFGLDNMGGGAAGRITVAGGNFDGTVNGGAGGAQNHTLTLAEAPTGQFTHTFTDPGHTHTTNPASPNVGQTASGNGFTTSNPGAFGNNQVLSINSNTTGIISTITDHAGGTSHTILPPAITLGKLLVVE